MNSSQQLLDQININNTKVLPELVNKLLIVFQEESNFFIGDTIIRFDRLRYLKCYYPHAQVDIDFFHKKYLTAYKALINNNPHVDNVFSLDWEEIDFLKYEVIICLSYDEKNLLEHLNEKYGDRILNGQQNLSVLSISAFFYESPRNFVFTPHFELKEHAKEIKPVELYISPAEQQWGENWLLSNGLKRDENLYIILDDTANRKKLLTEAVYFEFLNKMLEKDNVKILNFDEKNIGKEPYYKDRIDESKLKKIIFSKGLSLREVFCIISSSYTKLIFGPCTGIMHCSSSIFNNFFNRGLEIDKLPVMITYTGKDYLKGQMAKYWWGNSPLVNCLVLTKRKGQISPIPLNLLTEEERDRPCKIPTDKYTCQMLVDFVNGRQPVNDANDVC